MEQAVSSDSDVDRLPERIDTGSDNPVVRVSGFVAGVIGAIVLTGWALDVEPMKRIAPGLVAMNPTTACCFMLIGATVFFASPAPARWRQWPGRLAAGIGIAFLIGAVKLSDLMAGTDSGIDRFVFASKLVGPGTLNINAMAPNTALNFSLVGASLLLLSWHKRRLRFAAQACAVLTVLLSTMALTGYAYGVLGFYHVRTFFPMALHTAGAFLVVATGLLWKDPRYGLMSVLTSPHLGGSTARLLLPAIVGFPFLMGLVGFYGVNRQIFDPTTAGAMFVVANIFVLATIVLGIARRLDRIAIKLAAHTVALEEATRIADAASTAKSNFLANMSHEIRTPMSGVTGMLEILAHTKLDHDQTRIVSTIRSSARSLLEIINDILDFSKIEAGRLKIESVPADLTEIIETTTRLFLGAATAKDISIRCYVAPSISEQFLIDPVRLRQILSNLVSNAIKFTAAGGVVITADASTNSDGTPVLRIVVADTGIGISPAAQAELFKPFTQADDSTARKFGGTGLGLSICRRLVDLMGGTIGLESAEGAGTRITLTVPVQPVGKEAKEASADLMGIRVGLIGTDAVECAYLTDYLTFWGADVTRLAPETLPSLPSGEPFTLILAPFVLAERVRQATEGGKAILVGPPRRFVFFTHDDEPADRTLPTNDAIVTTALSRARIVTAVAVAVGRMSPEIEAMHPLPQVGRPAAAPDRDQAAGDGRLILLAEDHPVIREVITRQLRLLGYAADAVENGEAALAALDLTRYGLLLTDCNMPEINGFELTRRIRASETSGARLPIIALTANALDGEAERCLAAGMDDYLSKPVEMAALRDALERWLTQTGADCPAPSAETQREEDVSDQVLDIKMFSDMWDNDAEAVEESLKTFADSIKEDFDRLTVAIAGNDTEETHQYAHRIMGAARIVGGNRLARSSEAVQNASGLHDWPGVALEMPRLATAIREMIQAIEDRRES